MMLVFACCNAHAGEWKRLPSIPDMDGFAGSFAGISNGALLVAGGTNFPDKTPWNGGTKVWHNTVLVLEGPDKEWKIAGKLPRALGYGVSATYNGGLVCVGGSDQDRHYAESFRLDWRNGKLITTKLPALPKPIANSCGALVKDTLYIAGGLETPDSNEVLKTVWHIDLDSAEPKWKQIEDCPGSGRMLAVAGALSGAFWIMGGVDFDVGIDDTIKRRYLKDAYRYHPDRGWQRIADLPKPIVAAPSPAPTDATSFYLLGGDDGTQVEVAPNKHRGFSTMIFRYDTTTDKWSKAGEVAAPRVTVPCVLWNTSWVVPGGEVSPGIRSPQVWSWTLGQTK